MSSNSETLPGPLSQYRSNVFSQYGEDGLIKEILARIASQGPLSKWCVEFGAWDGIHLSNTYNLIKNSAFSGVLIEGDSERYAELCTNIPQQEVVKVLEFVEFEGDHTLDCILGRTPIPVDFDLLSIDIDGCDYYIFDSLKKYRPKIVCIEYNPTIPNAVHFVQEKRFGVKQGSSARAFVELARSKNYDLVAATTTNLFFVAAEFTNAVVGDQRSSLDDLRDDTEHQNYFFFGFDGTLLSNKRDFELPWHGIPFSIDDLQVLPGALRSYKLDYSPAQQWLYKFWLTAKRPALVLKKIQKKLSGA